MAGPHKFYHSHQEFCEIKNEGGITVIALPQDSTNMILKRVKWDIGILLNIN